MLRSIVEKKKKKRQELVKNVTSAESLLTRELHALTTELHAQSLHKASTLRNSQKQLVDNAMIHLEKKIYDELSSATKLQKDYHFFREEVEMLGDPEEWLDLMKCKLTSISNELEYADNQLANLKSSQEEAK
mmetsp:Transcript_27058/g.31924  ORF Transcript_27058/g.31924 Transcript_27058/m.31924 type:complete len:132 (+) Transcript_27058:89-484(+)